MSLAPDERPEADVWALLKRRVSEPARHWTFYIVIACGILVLGYLAVWVELTAYYASVSQDVGTSFAPLALAYSTATLAVAGPSFLQLVYTRDRMATNAAIVLIVILVTMAFRVSYAADSIEWVHLYGIPGLVLAVFIWWLANGEDELFRDKPPSDAASGGDPMKPLSGSNGGVTV